MLAAGCSAGQSANQLIGGSANQQTSPAANRPSQLVQPTPANKAKNPGLDDTNLEKSPSPQPTNTPVAQLNFQATSTNIASPTPTGPTATQKVDGSSLNKSFYSITAGETAILLLKSDHSVQTTEYPGLGEMVQSIDGVSADSKHFWEFFVNGKSSNVGASSYVLKDSDAVEWKLSVIN